MAITPGSVLGSYKIGEPLGAGGMGEVYRATQSSLGRQVAIKILSAQFAADPERLRRFEQEARAASALNHPNIISIYDVGRESATAFIAMELIDGKTLRALLEPGALPVKRTLHIAAQIGEGLAKAHGAGIVHRDLKPENVMVTRDGFVKVLDFGLAKLAAPASAPTEETFTAAPDTNPGTVLGTVGYMSPEQARGAATDFRSDIFSFGAILYEMATGKRPFKGESSAQTMAAIIEDEPQSVSELNPRVPAPLRWIIERCLAKDPEERYASTRDLARDLASVRDHLSESSMAASGVAEPQRARAATRNWLRIAAWALPAIGLGCAIGWFLPHPVPEPPVFRNITYSGRDSDPSVSPDGRTVAFISDRDGVPRIWLKQVENGSETALSEGPDLFPRFSPDGAWILFIRNHALYRMPALGGEPRKLIEGVDSADWSPDGKQIVFLDRLVQGPKTTVIVGIASAQDGSFHEIRRLANFSAIAPSWSPDGKTIAMVQEPLGNLGSSRPFTWLISADGKSLRKLDALFPGGAISAPTWSPSGREIIYSEPESLASAGAVGAQVSNTVASPSRVIMQDVDSGKGRVLFAVPAAIFRIELAAGGQVIFDSLGQRNNLKEVPLPGAPPGAQEHWLTRGYSIDRQPFYAPDSKSVIFSSSRSGDVDLWEVSSDSKALRRLTDHPAPDWDPFVTRDGKHLLWSSARTGNFEIWMADRDGSSPVQVSHEGVDAENPVETVDGWVLYASGNSQHPGLWKVRPDGSQATLLVAGNISWPDASPDGKYALYHVPDPTGMVANIGVVRVADGAPVDFEARGLRARFAPDGHAIVYFRHTPQAINGEIVSQPFPSAPGASVKVLVPSSPDYAMETFELSPDGTRAVISYAEPVRSLVMADGVSGIELRRK